jgi:2OG-Fe(II) oxygenase superfamily.
MIKNDIIRFTCLIPLLIEHCNAFILIDYSFLLSRCSHSSSRCSTIYHSSATSNSDKNYELVDPSGPSPLVLNLGMDNVEKNELVCVRNAVTEKREIEFSISRVSCSPNIYLLKNLLTLSECEAIMNHVKQLNHQDKKIAEVTEGDDMNIRSNCTVAWVQNEDSKTCDATTLPRELGRVAGNLLLTDEAKAKGWCEPLQVVHYDGQGGKFDLHHDGLGRSLTILYYLNGVGNTWFPFAQGLTFQTKEHGDDNAAQEGLVEAELNSRNDAMRLVQELSLEPGRSGILAAGKNSIVWQSLGEESDNVRNHQHIIQVTAGDAIAFFNYKTELNRDSGKEELVRDMRSVHAGLPTHPEEGEKWIANHWVHCEHFSKGWQNNKK